MVAGVLHLLQHNALLHLTHVFFLHNAHKFVEFLKDHVGPELVVLTHALSKETFSALF